MPRVRFTANIQRHVTCPERTLPGQTVRQVLDTYFADNERARGYVLDEQGELRVHMVIFIDGEPIVDRRRLSDTVSESSTIDIMQALSGG